MKYDPAVHHRRSIRLPDYDYSQPGEYFITLVTHQREPLFGEIDDGEMRLSDYGKIIWEVWNTLPTRYPQISLGSAVVMPNHFHVILVINDPSPSVGAAVGVGVIHELPQRELPQREPPLLEPPLRESQSETRRLSRRRMLLPLAIGYLKMNTAKQINIQRGTPGVPVWQRNYYEHIINSEKETLQIQAYIENNPTNWLNDNENALRGK